jgi:hypothetical protein
VRDTEGGAETLGQLPATVQSAFGATHFQLPKPYLSLDIKHHTHTEGVINISSVKKKLPPVNLSEYTHCSGKVRPFIF